MARNEVIWKKNPEAEDYGAALNYLTLLCPPSQAKKLTRALRHADTVQRAAKDLLRASRLPLLAHDRPQVAADLQKIHKGKPLSPILLIRGDMSNDRPLLVADGYHRICAVYYYDEDAPVRCRIADP